MHELHELLDPFNSGDISVFILMSTEEKKHKKNYMICLKHETECKPNSYIKINALEYMI